MAKIKNPNTFDYDRDGERTDRDREYQLKDTDENGRVSAEEEQAYIQKQGETRTEYTYDDKGNVVSQKTVSSSAAPAKPKLSASEMGYSESFLKAHPDVKKKLDLAIEFDWTEDKFIYEVETDTEFGKKTTASQAAFALGMAGKDSEEWNKKVQQNASNVQRLSTQFGVTLSNEQINQLATNIVRNGLTDTEIYSVLAQKYKPVTAKTENATGEVARISDQIKNLANDYGISVNDEFIANKTQQALRQGENWQTWLEGQRNVFRNSAKMMYPKVADQFDNYTMTELLDPYLNDASDLLGIRREQMKNNDPLWTQSLIGGSDGAMNRDEWIKTLRTDKKYNYQYTDRARGEASQLADEILSMFGMA